MMMKKYRHYNRDLAILRVAGSQLMALAVGIAFAAAPAVRSLASPSRIVPARPRVLASSAKQVRVPLIATTAAASAAEAHNAEAFASLAKSAAVAHKAPDETARSYEAFLRQRPAIETSLGVEVYDKIAALKLAAKDTHGAHVAFNSAWSRFHAVHSARPLLFGLALEAAKLYSADKQPALAISALRPFKAELEARRENTLFYASLLEATSDRRGLIDFGACSMQRQPALIAEPNETLFKPFIDALIAEQRTGTALQWARLRFAVCDFNAGAINAASAQLARVWLARDLSVDNAEAFSVALHDTASRNPLRAVALPPSFRATPAAIAARVAADNLTVRDHITLLLAAGDCAAAMKVARGLLADSATAASGVAEICRVLKARDLDLSQANAFVQYVKTGTGPNPLIETPQTGMANAEKWTPAGYRQVRHEESV